MQIKYLESARDDMMWFRKYYRAVFPAGKSNARDQLRRVLNLIADHPQIGHPAEYSPDIQEHPIANTPFSMLYRVQPDCIEIMRVLDQRSGFSNERQRSVVE